jgi:hypothetical protein
MIISQAGSENLKWKVFKCHVILEKLNFFISHIMYSLLVLDHFGYEYYQTNVYLHCL